MLQLHIGQMQCASNCERPLITDTLTNTLDWQLPRQGLDPYKINFIDTTLCWSVAIVQSTEDKGEPVTVVTQSFMLQ